MSILDAVVADPADESPWTGSRLDGLDPSALRSMELPELAGLAAEIRRFLVASVSATGGHLGSNLGVVELTLAVHRVFESPLDAVVWDTGHQAYVHKLVTGRAGAFTGLRRRGGLSGYPNRSESPHDLVENSHASTALSYASGLARARRHQGDDRAVVAVVGDGALTGGLAFEALNNIGAYQTPVLIVLNDNGRSYAPTVSRLCSSDHDGTGASPASSFFTSLGIDYRGPVDGHDQGRLEQELMALSSSPGPAVLHVRTVKGRGYPPAEADDAKKLHDIGPFDPATGIATATAGPTYTQAFSEALLAEAELHPELVAVTAAMAGPTGLDAFRRRFPGRFLDVGIAEQHAVSTAAGMAMGGLRPVVAIYSTFLNRAWDQIYYDVGLHRLPVIFCIDRAGITGEDGPSHHGLLDLALMTKVPGMTVLAPSSYGDVAEMLHEALAITTGPVAIRWPKGDAPAARWPAGDRALPWGLSARRLRDGDQVCLIGVGRMVAACEQAAEILARSGIGATVWDARAAAPIDPALIRDASRHPVVLTAEDGVVEGGVGSLVVSALGRSGGALLRPRVVPCGVPVDYLAHGRVDEILSGLGLDGPGLAATALGALDPGVARPSAGPG